MKGQNARKLSIQRSKHSIDMLNELNEGKRLILRQFEGTLMHFMGILTKTTHNIWRAFKTLNSKTTIMNKKSTQFLRLS
jgi:hypothetical protein